MSTTVGACLVCGGTERVRMQLTHWREPVGQRRFDNLPRCVDRDGCRERVLAQGDKWPLAEPAPKRTGKR